MADHAHDHGHAAPAHAAHNQPTVRKYVQIFVILFVVTMVEVGASNLPLPQWAIVAILIGLSLVKGVLVVLFYMHLRFDSRWFTFLFTTGMILATFGIIVFLALFTYHASLVQ